MAIGTPTTSVQGSTSSAGTSGTATVSDDVAVGDLHLVAFVVPGSGELPVSVTDSQSNTYEVAFSHPMYSGSNTFTLALYYSILATALENGVDTVTWSWTGSRAFSVMVGAKASGIAASSPLDQTKDAAASSSSTISSGSTSATAQADELLIGAGGVRSSTSITPDSFTEVLERTQSSATINLAYSIVSATGTYSYDFTAGASRDSLIAGIATFKGAAAPSSTFLPQTILI